MFTPQEVRSIETAAEKRGYPSIEIVPIEFRDRVLEKRAKMLGFVRPAPVAEAKNNALAAMLSL